MGYEGEVLMGGEIYKMAIFIKKKSKWIISGNNKSYQRQEVPLKCLYPAT
jgi:hypothetical protein